jgi:2-dehydro-3-deoxyphosphogluconate aldolase / (4S)-4-hydroxy-2-oxoglutarate aldolase
MTSTRPSIDALLASRVIPIIRTHSDALALRAVEWLREAGYTTFEVTLTVPGALDVIRDLRRDDGVVVGVGTVLTVAQAEASLDAGAQFLVSPILVEDALPLCAEAGVATIMSALTPNEVHRAWRLGSSAVKIFPASSMGGPAHVKALRSVFPSIPLVPTGGVNLDNLGAYLDAGAAAVGIGGDLISDVLLERSDAAEWIARARAYLDAGHHHARVAAGGAAV